jgi:hypothetical protein
MDFGNDLKPKQIPMKLYHGSSSNFTTPDPERNRRSNHGKGFYTTTDPDTALMFGRTLYEFDYKGGNFFNPTTHQFTDEQKQKIGNYYRNADPKPTEEQVQTLIQDLDSNFYRKNGGGTNLIDLFKSLSNSYDIRPFLKDIGLNDVEGIQLDFDKSHTYVVFDPKTLKMTKKTKVE